MWPFDPPPPADEPDAWYEDVGDAIYDVATAPENAIYFGLFLLAVTLTITIVCVFRGWSRSHPPPEAPPPNNASAPLGDESAGADAMDNDSPDADGFSVEDLYSTIVEDDHDVDGIGVH